MRTRSIRFPEVFVRALSQLFVPTVNVVLALATAISPLVSNATDGVGWTAGV